MTDEKRCVWKYDEYDDKYDTACGGAHMFTADGIQENHYRFCPYCGLPINEVHT